MNRIVLYAIIFVLGNISGATAQPIIQDVRTAQASNQIEATYQAAEVPLAEGLYHPNPYSYVDNVFYEEATWVLTYFVGGTQQWMELGKAQRRPSGDTKARATQGEAIWASYIRLDDGREARNCATNNLPLDAEYNGGTANPTRSEASGKAACVFQHPVAQPAPAPPAPPVQPAPVYPTPTPVPAPPDICGNPTVDRQQAVQDRYWYPTGNGWWKVVTFWSNQYRWDHQGERKLFLRPDQSPGLLGGGTVYAFPPSCEHAARAKYDSITQLAPVELWKLREEGLCVSC